MARNSKPIIVIGLGRFGASVGRSLMRMGHEVLGIDLSPVLVQESASLFTHVVEADATDHATLKRLGAGDCGSAVVGIGTDMEASLLATMALSDLKVPNIWAKATSERHGRILESVGAHHVVYPEARMGERVAHMVGGKMVDYIEFDDEFAIAYTRAPASCAGMTLDASAVRTRHGVTIVGIKRPRQDFTYARPETVIENGDLVVVAGRIDLVEKFAAVD
ncbi:TrkA family potassium uptake protein [Sphingomicrobium sp. XHP0235]|uniref:potassium channel family protein n=1 Tax=Sphingomicrobium aquimarinum TaxID=3133971 RepID=UPI0031FF3492